MCAQHVLNGWQGAVVHRGPGSNRGNSLGWGRGEPLNNQQQAAALALDVFMSRGGERVQLRHQAPLCVEKEKAF